MRVFTAQRLQANDINDKLVKEIESMRVFTAQRLHVQANYDCDT
jgi:hypothetical protein